MALKLLSVIGLSKRKRSWALARVPGKGNGLKGHDRVVRDYPDEAH